MLKLLTLKTFGQQKQHSTPPISCTTGVNTALLEAGAAVDYSRKPGVTATEEPAV